MEEKRPYCNQQWQREMSSCWDRKLPPLPLPPTLILGSNGTEWLIRCCRGQGKETAFWEEEKMGIGELRDGRKKRKRVERRGLRLGMWDAPKSQVWRTQKRWEPGSPKAEDRRGGPPKPVSASGLCSTWRLRIILSVLLDSLCLITKY